MMSRLLRRLVFIVSAGIIVASTAFAEDAITEESPLRVLMTVGGVGYNTTIVRLLKSDPSLELTVLDIDAAPARITEELLRDQDALLLYHRDNVAEAEERNALLNFLERGGGVVVLHHAIANYPDWPEWQRRHVGGIYALRDHARLPPSKYDGAFEGVAVSAGPHPITDEIMSPWLYRDESYLNLWISDDVTPLLLTSAAGSDELLAWVGPSKAGRVVYVQPGHWPYVMRDPNYLKLLKASLQWAATGE